MLMQRWSEAGLFRRASVALLIGQALLVVASFQWFFVTFTAGPPVSPVVSVILASIVSFMPLAVNGMTAWAVLSGSHPGRVVATVLSAVTVLWWVFRGWTGLVIAAVALVTIIVLWKRDTDGGVRGIRPARPFR